MSDEQSPKPAIPAWQRSQNSKAESNPAEQLPTDSSKKVAKAQPEEEGESDRDNALPEGLKEVPVEKRDGAVGAEESTPSNDDETTLEQMRAFLEDESVKAAPIEKKRAFFRSKDIPQHLIDKLLPSSPTAVDSTHSLTSSDFASFKQEEAQTRQKIVNVPTTPQAHTGNASAPPIITYPEFLVEARKPAPLVTFNRLLSTIYVAGGLATLTYAANQFLLKPMVQSLTEARHDFASHSQTKLDDFNERLSKIVTRYPSQLATTTGNKSTTTNNDDVESLDSDPTELFHRDMGTQTSPSSLSRNASTDSFGFPPSHPSYQRPDRQEKSATETHEASLNSLNSLLESLTVAVEKHSSEIGRKENMNELRHYLDTLMYSSPNVNYWIHGEFNKSSKKGDQKDLIDQVKTEIRSVKGSLLSAKRFPSAVGSGRVGGSAAS